MKKANIGKNAKVTIKWETQPTNYTKEAENNAIVKAAKKYGLDEKQITLIPVFNTEVNGKLLSLAEDSDLEILDPKFQLSLYKTYMKENNITDIPFEEIEKVDSMINSLINYESYEKNRRYKIKSIRWSNFLSYGEGNYIDLTQYHGLILLNGEPANQSGKSTFANDLIRFALFGKTKSGKADKFEDYFNKYLPDNNEVSVDVLLEIGGEEYCIRRKLIRPDKDKKTKQIQNNVDYFKVGPNGIYDKLVDIKDDNKGGNLQGESITKTNKIIKDTIGSEKDYDLIVSADSKDLDELISMKEADRGRTLSRWTGLSVLEDKEKKAKEVWSDSISRGRLCDRYNRETLKNEITEIEKENTENEKLITLNTEKVNICVTKIANMKGERDHLLLKKMPIDASISGIDLHTLDRTLEKIKEDGLKKRAREKELDKEISEIGDVEIDQELKAKITSEYSICLTKVGDVSGRLKILKREVETLAKKEVCEHSKQKCPYLDNTKVINEKNIEIEQLTNEESELEAKRDRLKIQIEEIDKKFKLYQEKTSKGLELTALGNEITLLQNAYREKNNIKKKLTENENIIRNNNEIDAKIRVLDASIDAEDKIKIGFTEDIVALKKDIEANIKSIAEKRRIISQIENEQETEKVWNLYFRMVGKDGVSKSVLNQLLPKINARLKTLLKDIADFDVQVDIDFKNDIQFWLVRDDTKMKLAAASGYERTMGGLALRHVLGQISSLSKPPFLLLDEILGGVAKENYDKIKKLYDKIVPAYDFVFHITHLNLEDWHDKIITVQKVNNISTLKIGE